MDHQLTTAARQGLLENAVVGGEVEEGRLTTRHLARASVAFEREAREAVAARSAGRGSTRVIAHHPVRAPLAPAPHLGPDRALLGVAHLSRDGKTR